MTGAHSARPGTRARLRPGAVFVALALLLGGCATPQSERLRASAAAWPQPLELSAVPFYPQEDYQCGPAALAMALTWAGVTVSADELTAQVYLPARQGSLQVEMLAGARRAGRVPYVLRPQLESVFAEVAAGHPVVVLQNLGLSWAAQWHYAVVVGFDLPRATVLLRSGTEARLWMPLDTFERTWSRAGHWALVVMPPTRLPYTAEELPYLQAVAGLEQANRPAEAEQAYAAALTRWPKSLIAHIGLANSRHARADLAGAEAALRQALRFHPDAAVVLNNLAQILAERGALTEALPLATRAVQREPASALYRETLETIRRRTAPGTP